MKRILYLFLAIGFSLNAKAQGCSDAGFCSIGNLAHQTTAEQPNFKQHLKLTLPLGIGDENVFVFAPGLEYGYQNKQWLFSGKLTGNYASGNLGSIAGLGDVYLSATYQFPVKSSWKKSFTLGTKLPLNQGNLKADGLSLPMQYQSSLGTVDLIAGVAMSTERWKIAAGWQQPLTGINRNNFLPQYWSDGKANAYPATNDFNRKGDVLLRGSYAFVKKNNFFLEGGLLGIYHLGEDSYIDANLSNRPINIKGSQGLTLNATASFGIDLNRKFSLGLTGGVPLVVRDVRPDGLTRKFVITPHLNYNF